ncbi:MAG: hypothetical protein Q8S44_01685 [Flavobacteriaceae bacterium]|nr:hypothetical protein [Flavobacteriaceae bacterium]
MKILENLKLDKWYGIVLYLGVLLIASSFIFKPEFLKEKHLFGLGIGMILIGIAYWMSEKHLSEIAYGGILSTQIIKHNFVSIILIIFGIGFIGLFGFKLFLTLI